VVFGKAFDLDRFTVGYKFFHRDFFAFGLVKQESTAEPVGCQSGDFSAQKRGICGPFIGPRHQVLASRASAGQRGVSAQGLNRIESGIGVHNRRRAIGERANSLLKTTFKALVVRVRQTFEAT
jgi:hypothetical protein